MTPGTHPADAVPRDRWGRPLIVPADGGKPRPYVRVSTLAKVLDDKTALTKWKQRMTAVGIGMRPDLAAKAAAVRDDKKALDEVVEEAMTVAGSSVGANIGTTLHALTEHLDAGTLPEHVPDQLWPDLTAYENAMRGITVIASEIFVVADDIQAAGSFDRLVALPDGRMAVADIKTGQHEPNYPHGAATQIGVYAHGTPYRHPGERAASLAEAGVSQDVGLLIHLPAGQGRCDLYLLDIAAGWEIARTATRVRGWFKEKPLTPYSTGAATAAAGSAA